MTAAAHKSRLPPSPSPGVSSPCRPADLVSTNQHRTLSVGPMPISATSSSTRAEPGPYEVSIMSGDPSSSKPVASFSPSSAPPADSSTSLGALRLDTNLVAATSGVDKTTTPRETIAPFSAGAAEEIEMEPVQGHRRRKSSLMNPISATGMQNGRSQASPTVPEVPGELGSEGEPSNAAPRDSFGDSSDEDLHDDEEMGLTGNDRSRKQKKRRRNTLLDNRIAREKNLSADERREADRSVVRNLVVNGVLIGLWYFFSLSISLYNKWMFDEDRLNFAFPLFTTSTHMIVQFCLSALVLALVPSLRPKAAAHVSDGGQSRHESEPQGSGMTKMFYLTRIGPCGAATSLDIGMGNMSLKFISLTFYTMCKSSSLAFVLLFAFVFRLETPTWRLVAIIATMTFGVILMVFGEVEFKFGGFILVISAAFFSGLRWALTQILLLRNPSTSNPFSSIFYLSPVMFLILICLAIPVEGFGPLWEGLKALSDQFGVIWTPLFLLFPGCIAFLMIASEFALLQRTSVVTLSIAGIFKEVVTISAASLVFDDKLTPINFVGLLTTMAAIGAYNYVKITKMRKDAQDEVHTRHAGVHEPDGGSGSGSGSGIGSDGENEDAAEETAGLLQQTRGDDSHTHTAGNQAQPHANAA